jgi:hypothetical protein
MLRGAHQKLYPTASDAIFRKAPEKNTSWYFFNFLSFWFSFSPLFKVMERFERWLNNRNTPQALIEQVNSIKPDLALSTSFVISWEWPLFRLLQQWGIPTWTHILSFDNLTSRGYLPIGSFDKYLVWNEKMAAELRRYYSVDDGRIEITGTPQFDFHSNVEYQQTKGWTLDRLQCKRDDYIVYCANHIALTPDEPALVQQIYSAFKSDTALSAYEFVVRLHPMDDYDRWESLKEKFPGMVFSYPWPHENKAHLYWGDPTRGDMELFSNTLRHSAIVLNIASTISIDACIHDRPVVCVGFSSEPASSSNALYLAYHSTEHYQPIMEMHATPVATDVQSLVKLAIESSNNPAKLSAERKAMVKKLCGNVDGNSAKRITAYIIAWANV